MSLQISHAYTTWRAYLCTFNSVGQCPQSLTPGQPGSSTRRRRRDNVYETHEYTRVSATAALGQAVLNRFYLKVPSKGALPLAKLAMAVHAISRVRSLRLALVRVDMTIPHTPMKKIAQAVQNIVSKYSLQNYWLVSSVTAI